MEMDKILTEKIIYFIRKETVLVFTIGAALISALFNPPSAQYLAFIDVKVLLCLFCLMIVVAGFKKLGAFGAAASFIAHKSRNMRSLTLGILLLTYFSAMVMTNDVALITLIPFTLILLDKIGENEYALLVVALQTIGANIGSSLTPIGNPQNLYLFSYFKIPLGAFIITLLPVVFVGGLLLALSVLFIEKKPIGVSGSSEGQNPQDNPTLEKGRLLAFVLLFLLSVLAIFNLIPIEWVSAVLVAGILILDRHLFREVDYGLLFTFIGFFIFVGNMSAVPQVKDFLSGLLSKGVYLISVLTSQIISNVPAAVLLSGFTHDYKSLLLGVNVGGMGTLIASMASVISYKLYTNAHPRMTRRYMKIFTGLNLIFLVVLSVAALIVLAL